MPSVYSVSKAVPLLSSTVITPSLPTFSITSAIKSPDLGVGGRDRGDVRDVGAVAHQLGQALQLGHQRLSALVQATLEQHRVRAGRDHLEPSVTIAWASTVAVVVPSPATSLVLVATSTSSRAPMFSNGSFELDLFGDGHAIVGDGRGADTSCRSPHCARAGRAWS